MIVPNEFPNYPTAKKIACIGEAPGKEEAFSGKPFVGASGRLLMSLMNASGLSRGMYFVGNVCQIQPPGNNLAKFAWDGPEIQDGLQKLSTDLTQFQPNVILALGAYALKALRGYTCSIKNWRGSIFQGCPEFPYKVVAAYHPAACLRQYSFIPILNFDIKKAIKESATPNFELPKRTLDTNLTFAQIIAQLEEWYINKPMLSFDIEGYANGAGITCIGFATSAEYALTIPFENNTWSEFEEEQLWVHIARILTNKDIPKVAQNGFYDCFVMAHMHGIVVQGLVDDTMLSHFELNCELEKGLAFQTSIYTNEPYYKGEREAKDVETRLKYNAKDCAVTYEIRGKTVSKLSGAQKDHYQFNVKMSTGPLLFMSLRGIRYDLERATTLKEEIATELEVQKKKFSEIIGKEININSPAQLKKVLYEDLKLPIQMKRASKGEEAKVTTNYEALVDLVFETDHPILKTIISIRDLSTKLKFLSAECDDDGRMRGSYNIVATETGRIGCNQSNTGKGMALHTIPEKFRSLFLADDGQNFFQADQAGSDGWTVAAHSAALGDETMLKDYMFGLKPAKLLTLAFRHGAVIYTKTKEELKELSKTVGGNEQWDYFVSKKIQHGSNYLMEPPMLATQVFIESAKKLGIDKAIRLTSEQARTFQSLYFRRYRGVLAWQDWCRGQLAKNGYLMSPNGHVRRFLGRRMDKGTLREFCAHEPQMNTTWATNLATMYIWEQSIKSGIKVIEPLHSVHDAVCGQGEDKTKIEEILYFAFNNPMIIHGVTVTIPYEVKFGESWGGLS